MDEIDRVISQLYQSISFDRGDRPRLDMLRHIFLPEGVLINNKGDDPLIFSVDRFIDVVEERVRQGALEEFEEREVWSRTEHFGRIAQRFSTYEARFNRKDPKPSSFGINSIQLIKLGSAWMIVSIIWNDETGEMRIPGKYLPEHKSH
ncbi:MAG: hypothetical protein A4E37_01988 [Methanoregulaceae archaeon PtaB.Bin056]|nr:MAG: hypothetical protein A4E37_01988 [Methanoregulaceae archaeon PtaB.Bin056]